MHSPKLIIPKQLVILAGMALFFAVLRVVVTDSTDYLYMMWNLFLASLAFAISGMLLAYDERKQVSTAVLIIIGIIWLLFFPNAPYVVTDIIHIGRSPLLPRWYDSVLLFTFAWSGMLFGLHSLSHMQKVFRARYTRHTTRVILGIAIVISSFGIYLGRTLRWNSWDIITSPSGLAADILDIFVYPGVHAQAYFMTVVFSVLIAGSYIAWKSDRI